MKLLALDCSAGPASCALWEDGRILSEFYSNVKLTHSQTLMPMVDCMLRSAGLSPSPLDGFAVSAGPGSFTGVRIGVAALKGLAFPTGKPCAAVSTLAAMAETLRASDQPERFAATLLSGADGHAAENGGFSPVPSPSIRPADADALLCCVMDARCSQVYNALFLRRKGEISRLCPDRALLIGELEGELIKLGRDAAFASLPVILAGDGAELCYRQLSGRIPGLRLAPASSRPAKPFRPRRSSPSICACPRLNGN